ncbi:MAG: hypothetical protein JNJ40_13605 [Bacteroidia bacterium]|nr:hypothetical protein [Bacteroidia bacterium]
MKKIILILSIFFVCKISKAQNQNTSPYPPPVVSPGNQLPTQSGPPYDATPATGMPNSSYTISTPPQTILPDAFIIKNEEYSISPATITPATPTTNTKPKQFQHLLYQDPMKTPKKPKLKTTGNVDGYNGKYVSENKQPKGDFTKKKHHFKKSKSYSQEKQGKTYASTK